VKDVAHVWWFISRSVGKLLPRIVRKNLALVVSSFSCEKNWNSYSFVYSKALNRLHSYCTKDLVYVHTNSRVLNQNVMFTDEAAMEWYKQIVVFEDFDPMDQPTNLMSTTTFLRLIQ
jgi:hypothetical protein